VLLLLGAGLLSGLCLWSSWRVFRRGRQIVAGVADDSALDDDPLEKSLLERELNLELNLGLRRAQAFGRAALFGGTGLAFGALTGGRGYDLVAGGAFALGLLGWAGCGELQRRIGSMAGTWRAETNRRRRRQGVDQSGRTR
jgi:hypothetical protein